MHGKLYYFHFPIAPGFILLENEKFDFKFESRCAKLAPKFNTTSIRLAQTAFETQISSLVVSLLSSIK